MPPRHINPDTALTVELRPTSPTGGDQARPAPSDESPLLILVRAMARAEARRIYRQADEQGVLSLPMAVLMGALALLALLALVAIRPWFG